MTHTFFEKNSNFEVEEQFDFDSIVAESPKAWLDAEGGLEADRMVADATSRAHREAVRQLETLKEDFQGA
jgi:hypothetical protein